MKVTHLWNRYRYEMILLIVVIITFVFGLIPSLVEKWYSSGLYPYMGRLWRILFGWIGFSLGDIFYFLVFIFLLYKIFQIVRYWQKKQLNSFVRRRIIRKTIRMSMIVYIVFEWMWGLNYHRLGSAYQMDIEPKPYNQEELLQLTDTLQGRLVRLISEMTTADSLVWNNFDSVCRYSVEGYKTAGLNFSFAQYKNISVKPMIWGDVAGYGGFSGYLNPFTGEAQANRDLPPFLQPYVICHEMAHQLGYAAEEEANMVGYLACRSSVNPAIRYSVYYDLLWYACRELGRRDTMAYKQVVDSLPLLVKQHNSQARAFYASFKNPLQFIFTKWYDLYLKANSQERGMRSYSYVTAWLIGYARKYGWENL